MTLAQLTISNESDCLVDVSALSGLVERLAEELPGPAHERPSGTVLLIARSFSHKIHSAQMKVQQELAKLANVVEESVSGIRVIKGFGAEAVQQSLGLPPAAFTYLISHGALDQDHILFLKQLLDGVSDADDRAAIVHMAKVMFGLFGGVFASIPHIAARETADAV